MNIPIKINSNTFRISRFFPMQTSITTDLLKSISLYG
jgi:hypothetical protein